MIDKGVVHKIQNGCSHSVPVLVPCADCVQTTLTFWERRVREECRYEMVDEVKRAKEMAASATAQLEAAGKLSERLANKVTGLESDNKRLLDSLHEAREQIDGMKAQLHAAQASKTFPRLVRE